MQAQIIVCGLDQSLLATRQQVLRKAGFDVLALASLDEILPIVQGYPIKGIVLCHTLSFEQQLRAITTLRRYRPAAKSLVLTKNDSGHIPDGAHASFNTSEGPRALLQALERLFPLGSSGLAPHPKRTDDDRRGVPQSTGLVENANARRATTAAAMRTSMIQKTGPNTGRPGSLIPPKAAKLSTVETTAQTSTTVQIAANAKANDC